MTDDLSEGRPTGGRDWSSYARPERRCSAHRKTGEQCKNAALRGTTVCGKHGGNAPQVKRKAHQRLEEAADRMARALLGIADNGESEAVRLAAIKHALALGGFTEKTAVELSVPEAPPWAQMMQGMTGIARMPLDESQRRRGLIPEPLALTAGDPSVPVDAEVVPAPEPPAQPDGPLRPPPWAGEPPPSSEPAGYVNVEDAAAFTADLQRRQDAAARAERRSGRIKRVSSRRV